MGRQKRPLPPGYGLKLRQLQKRSKEDLRKQVAFAVFFFTALFLVPGVVTFASGASPKISVRLLPVWGLLVIIIGLMIAANILAVMSLNGSADERRKNRLSLIAFCLLVAAYVFIAIVGSIYT
ncbi:hypothetical protein GCM10023195_88130 [Actinoallomurus liliacearum]|uniref:Uncharacterized protein n=1 Tax=Actinoallomurus liliacearum TaxID=1080073 RepID=A0ABP8TYG3_9ACTN